jgi:cbb3-type cytochrome oxidase maturation protein
MSVIYVLLPLAFVLGGGAVWAFVRATRAGQFDDLETPAHRILHDDPEPSSRRDEPPVGR